MELRELNEWTDAFETFHSRFQCTRGDELADPGTNRIDSLYRGECTEEAKGETGLDH